MKDLLRLFKQQGAVEDFDLIRIGLASPVMMPDSKPRARNRGASAAAAGRLFSVSNARALKRPSSTMNSSRAG